MTQFYALKRARISIFESRREALGCLAVVAVGTLVCWLALWKVWDIAIFIKAWWGK